jgi:hypothetical protein
MYMQYPCNPLVEVYTEIFYTIHEGDIPSVQCEVDLKVVSRSMRVVDGPSFILIYFNVSALAPLLS